MTTPGTILLVEDNPQDEMLILRALRKANLANRIDVARDGQQALDYLFCQGEFASRNPEEPPAVVLLDISLPRLSGLEVLERLRADPRTSLLPVVILTSSDEDRDRAGELRERRQQLRAQAGEFCRIRRNRGAIGRLLDSHQPAAARMKTSWMFH